MARLVWALICEHHTTDASGKNSYIGVFDNMTATIKGTPQPREPLLHPVLSVPFVLALHLKTKPGSPQCVARLKDPDGQLVLPEMRTKLTNSATGRHNWHLHFPRGIPIRMSGTYTFQIVVEGEAMRDTEVELPITLDIR